MLENTPVRSGCQVVLTGTLVDSRLASLPDTANQCAASPREVGKAKI